MKSGIYRIVNTLNDQYYLGSSAQIEVRWKRHIKDLKSNKHHCIKLQRSWNKYGEEAFSFEIVEQCSCDEVKEREQFYLDHIDFLECFNTSKNASGGDNISDHPNKHIIVARRILILKEIRDQMTPQERKLKYGHPGDKNLQWKGGSIKEKTTCLCGNQKGYYAETCLKCKYLTKPGTFLGKQHTQESKDLIRARRMERIHILPKTSKKISVNGIIFESLTKAAKSNKVTPSAIAYHIKKDPINYFYIEIPAPLSTGLAK